MFHLSLSTSFCCLNCIVAGFICIYNKLFFYSSTSTFLEFMLVSALAINRIEMSQTYRLRSLIFEQKFFASILDFSLVFFSLVLVLSSILLLKKSSTIL